MNSKLDAKRQSRRKYLSGRPKIIKKFVYPIVSKCQRKGSNTKSYPVSTNGTLIFAPKVNLSFMTEKLTNQ